jgi:hypothetical protein
MNQTHALDERRRPWKWFPWLFCFTAGCDPTSPGRIPPIAIAIADRVKFVKLGRAEVRMCGKEKFFSTHDAFFH